MYDDMHLLFYKSVWVESNVLDVDFTADVGSTGYTSTSAVLDVSTNHTNPFSSGSMFRRTGLEGDGVSYTDEGVAYSDPITCVVGGVPSQPGIC